MTPAFDDAEVERAAAGLQLALPRVPHAGRTGDIRAATTGTSMELADFRAYHPGDDLRHVDWNAVARTDEWVVRVRHDEVSPRVEVWLDTSASMGAHAAKARCARMAAWWACLVAKHRGLEPVLVAMGPPQHRVSGADVHPLCHQLALDGVAAFEVAIGQVPTTARCGLRVVVSDFLSEAAPRTVLQRVSRGAAGVALVQVLDSEELEPTPADGARLVDAETSEALEHQLSPSLIATYRQRLYAHVTAWRTAATDAGAQFVQLDAGVPFFELTRTSLSVLAEASR
ncbi:MAG: DUF58 domain-containing protein [Archangium sp.]|nr:DUF58 domain-containing protein [Archangium sp.]